MAKLKDKYSNQESIKNIVDIDINDNDMNSKYNDDN